MFLDLNLSIDTDKRVKTNTFKKSNAGNTILHPNSHHPKHIIKNIPVGEMLRAKRNCSLEMEFDGEVVDITHRLRERQYPNWMLNRANNIVKARDRSSLLHNNKKLLSQKIMKKYNLSTFLQLLVHNIRKHVI